MGITDLITRPRGSTIQFAPLKFGGSSEKERPLSSSSMNTAASPPSVDEKGNISRDGTRGKSVSVSSNGRTLVGLQADIPTPAAPHSPQTRAEQRAVNTIPPFVTSVHEDDIGPDEPLLLVPENAFVASHNYLPASKKPKADQGPSSFPFPEQSPSRRPSPPPPRQISRWAILSKLSFPPAPAPEGEKLVTQEFLDSTADYSQPWNFHPDCEDGGETSTYVEFQRHRLIWYKRMQHTILRNPIIPLVFRLSVWTFSVIALALGCSIHHITNQHTSQSQGPSSEMAIIVDAVAIVYILYITYDEYTGKPLGLRKTRAKMRLIFLDLFFIVFDSANLALAFETLSGSGSACETSDINGNIDPGIGPLCSRQEALAGVLFVALLLWLMNFVISVVRLVEKLR